MEILASMTMSWSYHEHGARRGISYPQRDDSGWVLKGGTMVVAAGACMDAR